MPWIRFICHTVIHNFKVAEITRMVVDEFGVTIVNKYESMQFLMDINLDAWDNKQNFMNEWMKRWLKILLLTPSGLKCGPGSLQSLLLWMWKPCLPSFSPTTSDTVKFRLLSGSVCWRSIFPLIVPEKVFSCQSAVHPSYYLPTNYD